MATVNKIDNVTNSLAEVIEIPFLTCQYGSVRKGSRKKQAFVLCIMYTAFLYYVVPTVVMNTQIRSGMYNNCFGVFFSS